MTIEDSEQLVSDWKQKKTFVCVGNKNNLAMHRLISTIRKRQTTYITGI
jgi:hypothetical protein